MGGTKRTRSGRERANPSASTNPRRKEDAELIRVSKTVAEIPRYSSRFQLFRQNRRQKAKKISEEKDSGKDAREKENPIFRASRFSDLPLSRRTLDGLAAAGFTELTGIQKTAIPQALADRDVLAAAPTGSGKTLAFLIPLLEVLWRNKWNTLDGLGALVLSPTRELSMQIFEVLRSVAKRHTISAGLVIGGKDFESERVSVGNMNVLVATPGRILHHMDHVAELDCSSLQVLVLDEADRILDMGFSKTLDAILANLPKERQTLLFSATQTKSIKALARLSLKDPEYVAVSSRGLADATGKDDAADKDNTGDSNSAIKLVGTPVGLSQSYAIVPSHEKLSTLWSFIKTHLKSKMIIFLASGKQVRFVFETFCKLRPGMSLLHIHGNMKQMKRTDMYDLFCRTKSAALFATDVASRGLDFPDVEWVIQMDCPDDVGTYVHRVGRTARFKSQGRSMLFLNEGKEESFLEKLRERKLELHKTKINPSKITSIEPRVAATVASNQELKRLAQRAFTFYVKSVYQQTDRDVFDINEIDFVRLARSYGLSLVPKISFRKASASRQSAKEAKERTKTVFGYRVHRDMMTEDKGTDAAGEGKSDSDNAPSLEEGHDGEDEMLKLKMIHEVPPVSMAQNHTEEPTAEASVATRKRKRRKLDLLKSMPSSNRIIFTDKGEAIRAADVNDEDDDDMDVEDAHKGIQDYAATVSQRLASNAEADKGRERDRVRAIHSRRRAKQRESNRILRPAADSQTNMLLAAAIRDSESDSAPNSDLDDGFASSSDESNVADGHPEGTLADDEKLAMQILSSRE